MGIGTKEALRLLDPRNRVELRERAHETTVRCVEKRFDFCSIINARSGRCTENCRWCAQSAHWKTGCETYGWVGTEACVNAAKEAEANGADRIGIVTSGRCLSPEDVENVCEALREMRKATSPSSRNRGFSAFIATLRPLRPFSRPSAQLTHSRTSWIRYGRQSGLDFRSAAAASSAWARPTNSSWSSPLR